MRQFSREFQGREVTVTLDPETLFVSANLPKEAAAVAATMGRYVEWLSIWTTLYAKADAEYRGWRASMQKGRLAADEKLAEWKVAMVVESDPMFRRHKDGLAELEGEVEVLRGFVQCMREKSQLVHTRARLAGAQLDAEAVGLGMRQNTGG